MQFLTLGDATFHVAANLIEGAPTVVCIHPLAVDLRLFDDLAARLAQAGVGCLRYDLRGHGLSDLGEPPRLPDDHAADLLAILDLVGIERATICGVSIGGVIAQAFYRLNPEKVERLALVSTGAKIGTAEVWNPRIEAAREGGMAAVAEGTLQRWFSAADYAKGGGLVALCRHMLCSTTVAGYEASCATLRDSDLTESLERIAVPTLCIAGALDTSTPPDFVRSMHLKIPGSRFVTIPGAGHVAPLQQPDVFAKSLLAFMSVGL